MKMKPVSIFHSALFLSLLLPSALRANPIFPGADPHAMVARGRYWIYPTDTVDTRSPVSAFKFYAYSSRDLVTWQKGPLALDINDIAWIKDDGARTHFLWAPAMLEHQGKFYFYYSVGPQNPTPSRIGVAVGDSPQGPFKDSGKPLLTGAIREFEAIDPMVFIDPFDDVAYLYAGGSAPGRLRIFRLKPNLIEIEREVGTAQPEKFTEGVFMHERDGVYYLSYSNGRWRDKSYSVHYSTAPSPTGPWTYRGALLTSDEKHQGPGHHSFIQNPATGQWFIVYHRWEWIGSDKPTGVVRQVAVDAVSYANDGTIIPVKMTDGTLKSLLASSIAPDRQRR